jgi:Abortive infection C-terminus
LLNLPRSEADDPGGRAEAQFRGGGIRRKRASYAGKRSSRAVEKCRKQRTEDSAEKRALDSPRVPAKIRVIFTNSFPANPMHISFAPQSIEALAIIISGGAGNDHTPPIGIYRSASKLESFMRGCNVSMSVGVGSRLPTLVEALERANREGDQAVLRNIAERAADPRDFLDDPERHQAVIGYLNARLSYDGLELQRVGSAVRLGIPGRSSSVVDALANAVVVIDFDTVKRDLDRALLSAEHDPEDAVTSACSVVESVCRSVLIELGIALPQKKDVQGLYQAVREPLGLTPDKGGVPDEIAGDVRTILGGLNSVVNGVGSLRTHAGDAHGRERGYRRIDARIARLAINSASTASLFVLETWQKQFPTRQLKAH